MSTGLKVWLWIVFVVRILYTVVLALAALVSPLAALISIALNVVFILGVGLILFKTKKLGLYLIIAVAAVNFVIYMIGGYNVIAAIIGAGLFPLITFLYMSSQWYVFD